VAVKYRLGHLPTEVKSPPRAGVSIRPSLPTSRRTIIQTLDACGVDLYLDQQAIDTTTPAGKLMFQVTGAFAEFERSMIRQRVNAGLKRAVEAGKQLGRPRIDPALERRIQSQLRVGKGILKVAAECGVGSGTVQRIKREMEEGRPLDVSAAA
jgi:DNA invertase Pin-like site-specific DNA recombinase